MIYARGSVIFIANPWAGNRIALKKKKIKAEYNSAEMDIRKAAGETSPVFVNHRKWEQNLHISDFFCIFAAGKKKTDKWGLQR